VIELRFFASLRDRLGVAQESLTLPDGVCNAEQLVAWLRQRGGVWNEAFADGQPLMLAVNQQMAGFGVDIRDGDEVAFFPPVTGG